MITFQPKVGSVVYCDYRGFVAPEMVKKRPVLVISKHKHNSKLVTIMPISTTEPDDILYYHVEMDPQFCSANLSGKRSWIKCDMINVVSLERLHLVRDKNSGMRHAPQVEAEIVAKVKEAIKKIYGL